MQGRSNQAPTRTQRLLIGLPASGVAGVAAGSALAALTGEPVLAKEPIQFAAMTAAALAVMLYVKEVFEGCVEKGRSGQSPDAGKVIVQKGSRIALQTVGALSAIVATQAAIPPRHAFAENALESGKNFGPVLVTALLMKEFGNWLGGASARGVLTGAAMEMLAVIMMCAVMGQVNDVDLMPAAEAFCAGIAVASSAFAAFQGFQSRQQRQAGPGQTATGSDPYTFALMEGDDGSTETARV